MASNKPEPKVASSFWDLLNLFELPKNKALDALDLLASHFPDLAAPLQMLKQFVQEKAGEVVALPATVVAELKALLDTGASEIHPDIID